MKIIFASNNQHKIAELKKILPPHISLISLQEAGIDIDIPEPHPTLEENAAEKAKTIYALTQTICFSEDTGLEVFSLNGAPGVHSARYAGAGNSFQNNIEKLLVNLKGNQDRSAQFRAVICLILNDEEYYFEGICKGRINEVQKGVQGFGYDPVFVPEGAEKTFAEMSIDEKNNYNHRRKAADKLVAFLNNLSKERI